MNIIAIGGAAFAPSTDFAIDRYILRQTRKKQPRVLFIPTASGDARDYIVRFYNAYTRLPCHPAHLPLFERTPDLRSLIPQQDVIVVGGGNTRSMLAVWREWGLHRLLRAAWRTGTVLAGVSAGAICWFDKGSTDSWADALHPMDCLGFLPGGCCPHYDGEKERRPTLHRHVRRGAMPRTIAIEDHVAAHFRGRKLHRVVSEHPGSHAFTVHRTRNGIEEKALKAMNLLES